jgi:predicted nuclease with RNAse H fold
MAAEVPRWAGVDVGARKGFDVAVIDGTALVAGPVRLARVAEVIGWLRKERPQVVAVDSPCWPAPNGDLSRQGERDLVKAGVCGIRYTPNMAALAGNQVYYAWIVNGFDLYAALEAETSAGLRPIECFPTATWSRIGGPKGHKTRARWSRDVLDGFGLKGLPLRMNQDARDAIGAALTAWLYTNAKAEQFGDIVVPFEFVIGAAQRSRP